MKPSAYKKRQISHLDHDPLIGEETETDDDLPLAVLLTKSGKGNPEGSSLPIHPTKPKVTTQKRKATIIVVDDHQVKRNMPIQYDLDPDPEGSRASSSRGGKYPEAVFKDNNKKWAEVWFVVANPALGLPPVLNSKWEEKPMEEEMVKKLKANKLTGATVALSFAKRLTQPIQERVHPCYEYSGRDDPTCGKNHKVSHNEAFWRVSLIVNGKVRDKGCPNEYCLKLPHTERDSRAKRWIRPPG
ncbi:hypothetical protein C2845_PM15G03260 [Panicum miliaceum]|uniref:Uncharacterized protein n=1 Tax=Panicum miliaceum TaxID=4540 RepID=A0A3L6Q3J3_PANMI|nr:hypothetical protein C2845_PM15G03260 [Panicum miliaceum]